MNSNTNYEFLDELKEKILELEKESLTNIVPFDDQTMVNKIIKLYEDLSLKYENK